MKRLVRFIWGLLLFFLGAMALFQNVDLSISGDFKWWRILLMGANVVCIVLGAIRIHETAER